MSELRVASLLPSATEVVCALGLRDQLVGVSHECDWPPEVREVPALTRTRARGAGPSGEIDREIRALVAGALSIYEVDVDALRAARPDVILTQDLCEVCAVSYDDVCAAAKELASPELSIVNLRPLRLADIWADVRRVGEALGVAGRAESLVAGLQARIDVVSERVTLLVNRPRTLTIEWLDPVMVGGTWMPELVALAGGKPLVTRPGEHAPTLSRDELAGLRPAPDVVLIKPCGFPLEKTLGEREAIEALLEGLPWPALERGAVFLADGNAYFNRSGPRIVDSLELLAGCLHPDAFPEHVAAYSFACRRLGASAP